MNEHSHSPGAAGTAPRVVLVPLTVEEQELFIAEDIADYAMKLTRDEAISPEDAAGRAVAELEPVVREEHRVALAKGERRWTAVNDDGTSVGWLWVTPPHDTTNADSAFLYQITVTPRLRQRGYALAMLLALEVLLASEGVGELRLNVSVANSTARRLYERAGYEAVAQLDDKIQLAKRLSPGAARAERGTGRLS